MAQRVYNVNSKTRFTLKTIHTALPGFVEWGGEVRRERKKMFWFVPYWSTEGDSPDLSVEFTLSNGTVVPQLDAHVRTESSPGFRKIFVNSLNTSGSSPTSPELMANVTVFSFIGGEQRILSHN
jgi:hypothetical protein